ncbi:MAG TPA: alkane 1-monooxygenase [Saprospiraceae bacterium]|nr:alkane 1-monooxygenase [Saprospiraceae bacterium]
MVLKDLKYLLAYIIPVSGFVAVMGRGWLSFITVIIAFVIIPILEGILKTDYKNDPLMEEERKKNLIFFDVLLFLNIPIVFGLLYFTLLTITQGTWHSFEITGKILSVGIIGGSAGINVAHELGHKSNSIYQKAAWLLLCPVLYMHFYIEHNRGHHLRVATPEDPATARKGEWIYVFWFRSIVGSYIHAWKLEEKRLKSKNLPVFTFYNEMIIFTIFQFIYLAIIYFWLGWLGILYAVAIALLAILLLETINYIEHYGIVRKKTPYGKYEKVELHHSWNSDHVLGRIMLYELTRHSDHHYKASKKYQNLKSYKESPQLPLGYPGSMLLSFIPPLWFYYIDSRINA